MKIVKRIIIALFIFIILVAIGFYIYTLDYYRATEDVDAIVASYDLRVEEQDNLTFIDPPSSQDNGEGIIFYPGGKVEAKAYMPLLLGLSEEGYSVVLVSMPMNLAVFDIDASDKIIEQTKGIDQWYLMGHSLGGAMASVYVENAEEIEGLILLGAYPVNDADVRTLAIYGTYDVKLDLEKVNDADKVIEILGGNHAYFGNYGEQEGDGEATITREEQQARTIDEILLFLKEEQ